MKKSYKPNKILQDSDALDPFSRPLLEVTQPLHPTSEIRDQLGRYLRGSKANPKRLRNVAELQEHIITYLTKCEQEGIIPNVSGLAVACGFRSRQTLLNYGKEEGYEAYFDLISFARLKVMEQYEGALVNARGNIIGLIFALKNAGGSEAWTDKNETHVTNQEVILKQISITEDDGKGND